MREEQPDPLWWLRGIVYVTCQGAVDLYSDLVALVKWLFRRG